MSVHLSAPVAGLTLADLYRFADLARAAGLNPETPVELEGEGESAVLQTPLHPEDAPAAANLSGTVGEVVGHIDELWRRFGGQSAS